jgi:hypothetical protein
MSIMRTWMLLDTSYEAAESAAKPEPTIIGVVGGGAVVSMVGLDAWTFESPVVRRPSTPKTTRVGICNGLIMADVVVHMQLDADSRH